jgi:hypothetical protein
MNRKSLVLLAFPLFAAACTHPIRDERNTFRDERGEHCIIRQDYTPYACRVLSDRIMIDDLALAYGTAR